MGDFVFNLSPNLMVGTDIILSLGEHVARYGSRFMLIQDPTFKDMELLVKIKQYLEQKSIKLFGFDGLKKSSDTETVLRALNLAEVAHVDGVIALGDTVTCSIAKAIACLYNETKPVYKYLEGDMITKSPLPLVQIPTNCDNPFLFSNFIYLTDSRSRTLSILKCRKDPSVIVLFDSTLYKALSLNMLRLMIFSGLSLAVDVYISRRSNFFTDALLKKAISLFLLALNNSQNDNVVGQNVEEILIQATFLNAMATTSSMPGLATAIAIAGNAKYDISVSRILTVMLRFVLEDAIPSNLIKVTEIANLFLENGKVKISALEELSIKGIEKIKDRILGLKLPVKLENLDLSMEDLASMAEVALTTDFINYIPRSMTSLDVLEILKKAY